MCTYLLCAAHFDTLLSVLRAVKRKLVQLLPSPTSPPAQKWLPTRLQLLQLNRAGVAGCAILPDGTVNLTMHPTALKQPSNPEHSLPHRSLPHRLPRAAQDRAVQATLGAGGGEHQRMRGGAFTPGLGKPSAVAVASVELAGDGGFRSVSGPCVHHHTQACTLISLPL